MEREEILRELHELVHKLKKLHGITQGQIAEHPQVAPAVQATIPYGNKTSLEGKFRQWMKDDPTSWPPIEVVQAIQRGFADQLTGKPYQPPAINNDRLEIERSLRIKAEHIAEEAADEIAWLRGQLEQCQKDKDRIWSLLNKKD